MARDWLREFSWDAARRDLDGLPGGGLDIANEAGDRHAAGSCLSTPSECSDLGACRL